jgi:ribosomal protein S18 acetylase RimI-like enzyme/predicted GNAT family acetyltransferase
VLKISKKNIQDEIEESQEVLFLMAVQAKELVGWLLLELETERSIIYQYHPIITDNEDKQDIAQALIKKAIEISKKKGLTRIQTWFGVRKPLKEEYKIYKTWFINQDFQLLATYDYMVKDINHITTNTSSNNLSIPESFLITKITSVEKEALYKSYYETYMASNDSLFLLETIKERRKTFESNLNPKYARFSEETSYAIIKKDANVPAGFCFVVDLSEKLAFIVEFGIHPDYRRMGLAKYLLNYTVAKLKTCGKEYVTLTVDNTNIAAVTLYRSIGFARTHSNYLYSKQLI